MARAQCDTPLVPRLFWGAFEKIEFLVHTLTYSNKGCGLGPQSLQRTYACDYKVCTCKFAKMYHLVKKIRQEQRGIQ